MLSKFVFFLVFFNSSRAGVPIVLTTWNFQQACQTAWNTLENSNSPLDALEAGCRTCQDLQCDFTVGYGGSPDENGESTLDALIFDGNTMNMGAVGNIRKVKDAVGVARRVLENTQHSFLVGDLATQFATSLGFTEETLQTNYSLGLWKTWKEQNCQPNFWSNVSPDSAESCGPYKPNKDPTLTNEIPTDHVRDKPKFNSKNHDTIGMIVIGGDGHVVAGTSTNGANHKIPGRVGDSPIPGAGAYADSRVGAAVGTGDGDIMMRFLPSFLAVEQLRQGASPSKAAKIAISRITEYYPKFMGAVIVTDNEGNYAAACNGIEKFPFYVANGKTSAPTMNYVRCSNEEKSPKTETESGKPHEFCNELVPHV